MQGLAAGQRGLRVPLVLHDEGADVVADLRGRFGGLAPEGAGLHRGGEVAVERVAALVLDRLAPVGLRVAGPGGGVVAADHGEGARRHVVLGRTPLPGERGELLRGGGLALGGLLQLDDDLGGVGGAEEGGAHAAADGVAVERLPVEHDGLLVGPGDQLPEGPVDLLGGGTEVVGVGARGGPLGPPVEGRFGAPRPPLDHAPPGERRVDGAVQHEPVGPPGEELGVDGAQIGAVRVADVGEFPLAEDRAEQVHVAGGVAGGEVREHVPRLLLALVGEAARPGDVLLEALLLVGPQPVLLLGVRPQETGLLSPTPRGSKPMRSYVARAASGSICRMPSGMESPGPPGPPGLESRTPWRLPGSVLLIRDIARSSCLPSGAR